MADLPIAFSAPMVRALLEGRKTQTRRVQPFALPIHAVAPSLRGGGYFDAFWTNESGEQVDWFKPRYAVGDRLYVREAWRTWRQYDDCPPRGLTSGTHAAYEATPDAPNLGNNGGKLRPGMFLPRWASRITLTVTDVRVQRLQEISEADAVAEGLRWRHALEAWTAGDDNWPTFRSPIRSFAGLWNHINAARGHGWDANPWVAAYTFTPALGNIDQVPT